MLTTQLFSLITEFLSSKHSRPRSLKVSRQCLALSQPRSSKTKRWCHRMFMGLMARDKRQDHQSTPQTPTMLEEDQSQKWINYTSRMALLLKEPRNHPIHHQYKEVFLESTYNHKLLKRISTQLSRTCSKGAIFLTKMLLFPLKKPEESNNSLSTKTQAQWVRLLVVSTLIATDMRNHLPKKSSHLMGMDTVKLCEYLIDSTCSTYILSKVTSWTFEFVK